MSSKPSSSKRPTRRDNKYMAIAANLEERIRSGELEGQLPGHYELGAEFGVTHITIKKALDQLVEKGVVEIRHGRGTFVRLNPDQLRTIGVLLHTTSGAPLHGKLIDGIQQTAQELGYRLQLDHHDGNPKRALSCIQALAGNPHLVGCLYWPTGKTPLEKDPVLEFTRNRSIPVVLVPDTLPERSFPAHVVRSSMDMDALAKYLVSLKLSRICCLLEVDVPGEHETDELPAMPFDAFNRLKTSLRKRKGPVPKLLEVPFQNHETKGINLQPLLDTLHNLDVMVCLSSPAFGLVVRLCVKEGIRLPRDLRLVSVDETVYTRSLGIPALDRKFEEVGSDAVRILDEYPEYGKKWIRRKILTPLVIPV